AADPDRGGPGPGRPQGDRAAPRPPGRAVGAGRAEPGLSPAEPGSVRPLLPALDREPDGPRGVKQEQVLIAGLFQRATDRDATRLTRYHLQRRDEATGASIRRRRLMDSCCPCAWRKKHKSVLASLLFVGNPLAFWGFGLDLPQALPIDPVIHRTVAAEHNLSWQVMALDPIPNGRQGDATRLFVRVTEDSRRDTRESNRPELVLSG